MVRIESMYTRCSRTSACTSTRSAVRLAGVIHETRLVAIDAGVDHGVRVDDEQEGVVIARILVVVTAIRLRMRHALTQVLDDACAARDAPRGEHTQTVQARIAHLDQRRLPAGVCPVHTATGAPIGA